MVSMDREAAPLLAEKQQRSKENKAHIFVRVFICAMVIVEVAGIVLAVLKITNVINWPWLVTLIPLWTMLAMYVTAAVIFALADKDKK